MSFLHKTMARTKQTARKSATGTILVVRTPQNKKKKQVKSSRAPENLSGTAGKTYYSQQALPDHPKEHRPDYSGEFHKVNFIKLLQFEIHIEIHERRI